MRCKACDCELTDFESTRKGMVTGDYLDLCGSCLAPIMASIDTSENFKLYDPERDVLDFGPSVSPDTKPDDIIDDLGGPDEDEV